MLAFNALFIDARPLTTGECIEYECRDTIIQRDTVWFNMASDRPNVKVIPTVPPHHVLTDCAGTENVEEVCADGVFNRGIGKATILFVPKGTLAFGLTASYNSFNPGAAENDAGYKMLFSLLDSLDGSMKTCGVAPQISYFIANNTSVGLRFDYAKTSMDLNDASLALGDLMSFNINDMHYLKQSYSGSLTLRHYMAIANSRRFAIFVEGRGTYEYAQSKSYKVQGVDMYGTYQDIYKLSLGIVPGIVCFVMDNAAFEVSVGVLGFDTQKVKQLTNQVEYSEMKSSGANFKVNLLTVNLGTTFYIYPKRTRR